MERYEGRDGTILTAGSKLPFFYFLSLRCFSSPLQELMHRHIKMVLTSQSNCCFFIWSKTSIIFFVQMTLLHLYFKFSTASSPNLPKTGGAPSSTNTQPPAPRKNMPTTCKRKLMSDLELFEDIDEDKKHSPCLMDAALMSLKFKTTNVFYFFDDLIIRHPSWIRMQLPSMTILQLSYFNLESFLLMNFVNQPANWVCNLVHIAHK